MYQIAIVIFDHFTDVDFFLLRDILGRKSSDWTVKVLGTKSVHTSTLGMEVKTDGHVREVTEADAVLFSSGYQGVPAALNDTEFMSALKLNPNQQLIGSICAGAFFLAKLGLLDDVPATTHPDAKPALEAEGICVLDKPLVVNGNVATAGGCLSQMYLTGWLIERLYDADKRRATHRQLIPAGQSELFDTLITQTIAEA
ncbi:DJ-1/PfpI family protein [Photobacterium galatheae]|uniref:Thiamine biosynthesis protein ThiJ n=1 Tax=Photobacterium galatheae TaxID=1654360 RepID=A0A066RSV0_9GAMM|nr:DJ-1/PfpI family protein [Photobacterium galatheae]KDM93439.1 thiamine biosynthesis protein ThiJ [Photobacterium galatheae]MCM0147019.1 DJ-1/PfpI family protein [Photobacterium galatheae]